MHPRRVSSRSARALALGAFAAAALAWAPGARAQSAAPAGGRCVPAVASYELALPGRPYAAVVTADEQHAFVSIFGDSRSRSGLAVLACAAGRYALARVIALPPQPAGLSMTHDGKLLVVADGDSVAFIDVAQAIAGGPAVLGSLQDIRGGGAGAIETNVTPDDRFAFVSDERNASITVIDLARARANGFTAASIVGGIPTGTAPIALTFTADGRYLLSTSERARRTDGFSAECKPEGRDPALTVARNPPGEILVIDVAKAQTDPAHAVRSATAAGCSPVRLVLSPDGASAWVTARNSNAVLGFSVAKLVAGDRGAQLVSLPMGAAPVPVIASADGAYVLAANSNRFGQGGQGNQVLSVFDAREAAKGRAAALGQITVGMFPRNLTRTESGSLIVLCNWGSKTLTVFDAARLRELIR